MAVLLKGFLLMAYTTPEKYYLILFLNIEWQPSIMFALDVQDCDLLSPGNASFTLLVPSTLLHLKPE